MKYSEIKHNEANVKIYFTRDYSIFNKITGNRTLNLSKVQRIKEDIQLGFDMLRYCPIIIDKDMNVIDGQHRLYVAEQLKSNIWYVITDKVDLYDIAKMNTNTEKWNMKDYLDCYIATGNNHYKDLKDFIQEQDVSLSVGIPLLECGATKSGGNSDSINAFKRGLFKNNYPDVAKELLDVVNRFYLFSHYKSRSFIQAIHLIRTSGLCDMEKLVEKFNSKPEMLIVQANAKLYCKNLEEIYNLYAKERKIIFK